MPGKVGLAGCQLRNAFGQLQVIRPGLDRTRVVKLPRGVLRRFGHVGQRDLGLQQVPGLGQYHQHVDVIEQSHLR